MFERILIANRGEISCRIIRSARRLGIQTVAVYSDADRDALHVRLADQAIHIGGAAAAESYLQGGHIIAAAQSSGAGAIHPGYGFLSENASFARACEEAGIVFIGPRHAAIEAMGSKARAKTLMAEAEVPLIPGYHGDDQGDERLRDEADAMGYPVLLKATAGGGGKGMRAVASAARFAEELAAARREAAASFGDDRMLVEKLIEKPRHVEVQVFCDSKGNGVYLSERDCSIQRRHQKVIEEAPAPGLSEELRQRMGETAVKAARAIDYRGAGTVEFLLDALGDFYFMEMNTRLQVEHPVTEMVTGLDLVEWQLRVAAGEALPLRQDEVSVRGHAMEARIYAEDVAAGFLPSTGTISYLRAPRESDAVRIDTGVVEGSEISPYYDPMIAKLIVHGNNREEARRRLVEALREYRVAGTRTNIEFLHALCSLDAFAEAKLDTGFIKQHASALPLVRRQPSSRDLAAAAIALTAKLREATPRQATDPWSPWAQANAWRMNSPARLTLELHGDSGDLDLTLAGERPQQRLECEIGSFALHGDLRGDMIEFELDGRRHCAHFSGSEAAGSVFWGDREFHFARRVPEVGGTEAAGDASFAAPMHGTVVALVAEPGAALSAGDPVIVIEAMKMEQTLRAPATGKVFVYHCAAGDLVDRGQQLLSFEPEES